MDGAWIPLFPIGLGVDCVDSIVLTLLGAAILKRWRDGLVIPFLLTLAIVLGLYKILPLWAVPRNGVFGIAVTGSLLVLIGLTFRDEWTAREGRFLFLQRPLSLILHCLIATACLFALALSFWAPDWFGSTARYRFHLLLICVFLFYAVYQIAPWRWLPVEVKREMGKLCLYLAIVVCLLRLCVWGFAAFEASFQDRIGSFKMRGAAAARTLAGSWNFTNLETWIVETRFFPKRVIKDTIEKENIDPEMWPHLTEGMREAEAFRLGLLTPDEKGLMPASLLAQAIAAFPNQVKPHLIDRPNLDHFQLSESIILKGIQGAGKIDGFLVFHPFEGQWFGLWDEMQVNHDWSRVDLFDPPRRLPVAELHIRAYQYCWVGDGFGWNIVAETPGAATGDIILGTVSHVIDGDITQIRNRRPHVGIDVGGGRLIWITQGEVFFEEILPETDPMMERYAITGFFYAIKDKRLAHQGNAFQAVYSSELKELIPWFQFSLGGE